MILNKPDYLAHITERVNAASLGSRVLLMTMTFEPDLPGINGLTDALVAAGQRDADVLVTVDAHCFLARNARTGPLAPGPLWLHNKLPGHLQQPYARRQAALERLQAAGCQVVVTNKPDHRYSLPIAGRSHIKTAIFDDELWVGGCNLDQPDNLDLMLGINDRAAADSLHDQLVRSIAGGTIRRGLADGDRTMALAGGEILIDAGVKRQSVILDRALQMIDEARDWLVLTCQFFPTGVTARHLQAARNRGVDVRIYYPHLDTVGLADIPMQAFSRIVEHARVSRDLFKNKLGPGKPRLHAKVIANEGSMMIGSNNYVDIGVKLGTAELAYYSQDAALAQQMLTTVETLVQ